MLFPDTAVAFNHVVFLLSCPHFVLVYFERDEANGL